MKIESDTGPSTKSPSTSTPCKGRPRDEQAHQAILEFTRKLAAEKDSYNNITIEAISRGAHMAKITICRWWKTKNALARIFHEDVLQEPRGARRGPFAKPGVRIYETSGLVREACFLGRLPPPNTGSPRRDLRGVISQEAAIHQGPVTPGILAGFVTDSIERYPCWDAIDKSPRRSLQQTIEDLRHAAQARGEDTSGINASRATDQIEMTL
ncbi:MAG: helix-turn-helix transcriptional regulator [bacterium]|nr:helix-turn-helix transcriptional regulator [bacterium]